MCESQFPCISKIQFHNKSVEKAVKRLDSRTTNNLKRFFEEAQTQSIKPGRYIRQQNGVWIARLGKRYRLSFKIDKDENMMRVLHVDKHNGYERYLNRIIKQ